MRTRKFLNTVRRKVWLVADTRRSFAEKFLEKNVRKNLNTWRRKVWLVADTSRSFVEEGGKV